MKYGKKKVFNMPKKKTCNTNKQESTKTKETYNVIVCVYQIFCKNPNVKDFYIGRTIDFTARKRNHKNSSNLSNSKLYRTIREHGGWDNWVMCVLEEYPSIYFEKLSLCESIWAKACKPTLNSASMTYLPKDIESCYY